MSSAGQGILQLVFLISDPDCRRRLHAGTVLLTFVSD
jgi:hypothetical protein